jgi:PAS domain S-box-containing protein
MSSQWLAVEAGADLLARARQIQKSWESLLPGGALDSELPPEATTGLRPVVVESWRRALATGLDPTDLLPSIEADPYETRERWLEHPLGSLTHVLVAQLQQLVRESESLVQVTDPSGLTLHLDGVEWLKEQAAEMNLVEGARCSETVNGTNGVGTALAVNHPVQVFAFEHFSHHHREWVCSGAPIHDPVSGRLVGVIDLSSPWKIAHPRSLELVTTAARTMGECLLENRRDQDARLRRRYGDLRTKGTDLLVNRDGYVLVGDNSSHPKPLDVPESGGEIAMDDGSLAVAEPLGQGEAYLVRRVGPCAFGAARTKALERAERRAHEEAGGHRRDANVASGLPSAESDRRVSAYFEAALDCVIMADASGRVVEFNPAAERTFGYTRDEALGRTMAELIVPPSLREGHSAAFARFVETRRGTMLGRRLELTGMRADGSEFPVELALSQVEAEPVLICGALRDISAAKQAEGHLRELADEQAALRRVATLVAHESSPQQLFATVAEQVAQIINVPLVRLVRYESDGSAVELIGGWAESLDPLAVGTHWQLDGPVVLARVWQSGRPARVDDYTHLPGQAAAVVRQAGMRSGVACPITVEGRLWGAIAVFSPRHEPFPENTEARLADFTELVATALANAESRGELAASEARARKLAEEQAALRRVATLVAHKSSPDEIFAVVAEEVGHVLCVPIVALVRYETDGSAIRVVSGWSESAFPVPMGTRLLLDGPSHFAEVWATRRPARLEDPTDLPGEIAAAMRQAGVGSGAASPILVEGRIWGAMAVGLPDRLPDDTEARLADFTELVSTAIANSEARDGLRVLLDEQAALRRVATLVAASAAPSDVFAAVTAEIALVLDANATLLCRADPDGAAVVVGSWGDNTPRLGTRLPQGGRNLTTMVLDTGHPARIESYVDATGDASEVARSYGLRSAVGAPILVEGRLWGLVIAGTTGDEALPPNAEERLAGFSELVATAISNATARAELVASRARIVAAGDEARREIERDLHDGAQQQLVTLAVGLRATKERVPPYLEELQADLAHTADGLTAVLNELREISRGIHPAILTEGGLGPALKALARRSGIPVEIDLRCDRRLAEGIEVAAYYVVSEALTNAAKHAQASRVRIAVHLDEATLDLSIHDDGLGGADATRGSGLIGLRDRVEALGGTTDLASPPGSGTRLDVQIPLLAQPSVASNSEPLSRV